MEHLHDDGAAERDFGGDEDARHSAAREFAFDSVGVAECRLKLVVEGRGHEPVKATTQLARLAIRVRTVGAPYIFAFRGRQLSKIRWLRFGIGGGIVSAIFLPTFISVARFMSGDNMLPLTKLLSTGLLGLMFGGIAAAGTLRLAQVADRSSES